MGAELGGHGKGERVRRALRDGHEALGASCLICPMWSLLSRSIFAALSDPLIIFLHFI